MPLCRYMRTLSVIEEKNPQSKLRIFMMPCKQGDIPLFVISIALVLESLTKNLITAIDNCTNFILVLGVYSLERCTDESDWLYNEVREALLKKKNIICVFTDEVQFPDSLPEEINDIRYQNGLKFDVFYFDNFIDKLISQFFISEDTRSESDDEKDFIII